jgi:hypothetical protein
MIYALLRHWFPTWLADLLAVGWYVLLLVLIYLLSGRDDPGFVYLDL